MFRPNKYAVVDLLTEYIDGEMSFRDVTFNRDDSTVDNQTIMLILIDRILVFCSSLNILTCS